MIYHTIKGSMSSGISVQRIFKTGNSLLSRRNPRSFTGPKAPKAGSLGFHGLAAVLVDERHY